MILVILGTQDKQFTRLLEAVDKEIEKGTIKDKVVVQAGQTKYESKNMEIFDLVPAPEFEKLMDEADLVITHGGAGSILSAIKKGKKVIAAPRLAKYQEHHNDHQKQIIGEFAKLGYIQELKDFNKLGNMIKKIDNFKPKKFESNTENMIKLIEEYIIETNHTAWYHKYRESLWYLFFGGCTTLVNIVSFMVLRHFNVSLYISNMIAWIIAVVFAFITNKLYVFESKDKDLVKTLKEFFSFIVFRLLTLAIDMGIIYLMIDVLSLNELLSKIVSNIVVIVANYFFSKIFIFKK